MRTRPAHEHEPARGRAAGRRRSVLRRLAAAVLACGLSCAVAAWAPADGGSEEPVESLVIDLPRAIDVALERNFGIRQARNSLASSQSSLLASENRFDFKLATTFADDRTFARNVDRDDVVDRDVLDDVQSLTLGLDRELTWGASFGVTASIDRIRLRHSEIEPLHGATYGVSYTQPLWGGRGRRVATEGLVNARLGYLEQARRLAEDEMQLVASVVRSFHGVVRREQVIEINRTAVERAEERLGLAELRLEEGLITPIDVARSERDLRDRQNDLVSAREDFDTARDELLFLLGLPLETPFVLERSRVEFDPLEVDLDAAVEEALAWRSDLRNQRDAVELAELATHVARSSSRPRLDLTLSAGFQSVSGEEPDKLFDLDGEDTWTSSMLFTYTFGERSDDEALVRALIAEENLRISLERAERQVVLEVRRAVRSIRALERRVQLLRRNVDLARESLRLATLQFEEDLISTTDLIQDQDNLVRAELAYVQALADHASERVSLDLTLGRYYASEAGPSEFLRPEPEPPSDLQRPPRPPDLRGEASAAGDADSPGEAS